MSLPDPSDVAQLVISTNEGENTTTPSNDTREEVTPVETPTPSANPATPIHNAVGSGDAAIQNVHNAISQLTDDQFRHFMINALYGSFRNNGVGLSPTMGPLYPVAAPQETSPEDKQDKKKKEILKDIQDAVIVKTPGDSDTNITTWRTDVATIAKDYPFKGAEAIRLLRKVVQEDMWIAFHKSVDTTNPPDENLDYFLDIVVELFLKAADPAQIMYDLMHMNIDSLEDVKGFMAKFDAFFGAQISEEIGLLMLMARMSRENFNTVNRDTTINVLNDMTAWATRHLPAKPRKRNREDSNSEGHSKNKRVKKHSYKCSGCKTNDHVYYQCPNKKNRFNTSGKSKGSQ